MSKYKISVSFDGQNFFWIVVDKSRFIKNPTEDDLKDTKNYLNGKSPIKYNETNICPTCLEEKIEKGIVLTDNSILYPGNAHLLTDKNGKKTKEWVCHRHKVANYRKYDSNSFNNIRKLLRDRRTGNLRDSGNILGDNCEKLTEKWLGTKRLSIIQDNYNLPLDHTPIPNGVKINIGDSSVDLYDKIVQTKGRLYLLNYGKWGVAPLSREWIKEFDYLIIYCISEDGRTIERIYFIPKTEIYNPKTDRRRTGIAIYKNPNPSRGPFWYEQYRVIDEEVLRKINEIWKEIIE